jgi:hypothetical protein
MLLITTLLAMEMMPQYIASLNKIRNLAKDYLPTSVAADADAPSPAFEIHRNPREVGNRP